MYAPRRLILLAVAVTLTGCGQAHTYKQHAPPRRAYAPPPHAPAHGHRHKHRQDVELRYDADLHVYVVVGRRHHFFHEGNFYRQTANGWWVGAAVEGPYWSISAVSVPEKLRKRAHDDEGADDLDHRKAKSK